MIDLIEKYLYLYETFILKFSMLISLIAIIYNLFLKKMAIIKEAF